jgi:hypothetical protein
MTHLAPVNSSDIAIPVKRFMLTEQCPPAWRLMDLYVFRDEEVVFYVGQSYLAFDRVWEHLRNGFKGRSVIGRFILCNWPTSLRFMIELMSSKSERFAVVENDLDKAERYLIQQWAPCFNEALNTQPTPCPDRYACPNAKLRCSRSLNKLIHEAARAVKADDKLLWLEADG